MKLNPNCVRDVLLEIEKLEYNFDTSPTVISKRLPDYSLDEIDYTCLKLYEGNFISATTTKIPMQVIPIVDRIFDITFAGHEFLNSIRGEPVWNKVKSFNKSIGSTSLEIIKNVAVSVAYSMVMNHLGN